MNPGKPSRIASIDILRAITMLLMIFVNDLWSLENIPSWLGHTKAREDGMGLADIVFPAFLVIVGMSVPFSIISRHNKGESTSHIILHIILRALALLIMGLFLVNGENINEASSGISRFLWNTLCCLAFIFIWNAYPATVNKKLVLALKIIGWLILIILAWIFRGEADIRFNTFWWGILGLIGWAYLISALVYAAMRGNIWLISAFWILCISISVASHADLLPKESFLRLLTSPFGEGAMPAFVTTGMLTSLLFTRLKKSGNQVRLIGILLLSSGIIVAAGLLLRHHFIISKILATPTWVLICSGTTVAVFVLVYLLVDLQRKDHWFNFIKPAGTNTLLCYLLPYFAYALVYGLLKVNYPEAVSSGTPGLLKSFTFSLVIIWLAGILGKAGIRLKL